MLITSILVSENLFISILDFTLIPMTLLVSYAQEIFYEKSDDSSKIFVNKSKCLLDIKLMYKLYILTPLNLITTYKNKRSPQLKADKLSVSCKIREPSSRNQNSNNDM